MDSKVSVQSHGIPAAGLIHGKMGGQVQYKWLGSYKGNNDQDESLASLTIFCFNPFAAWCSVS